MAAVATPTATLTVMVLLTVTRMAPMVAAEDMEEVHTAAARALVVTKCQTLVQA
jgi:hypothetical protein